jgi:IMP dehydrogenase
MDAPSDITTLETRFPLALSFDDVLLEPGYSEVLPTDVSTKTKLGPIHMNIPILSAAMDTVTESRTAIALAQMGGIGVLHKNLSFEDQASEVRRVKKFQHAVISSPLTIQPEITIEEVRRIIEETEVTGFPVINAQGILVGMCTGRDIRFVTDLKTKVKDIMSAPVHTLPAGASPADAQTFFRKYKVEKLPLVDKEGKLRGLMTSKDLRQATDAPEALRDKNGSLFVAAAVGAGLKEGVDRAMHLIDAGCDMIVVDSAHGHSQGILKTLQGIREKSKDIPLVGGNIGTADGAKALILAGANIVKIGIGPGSICTTRIVSGAGVPQLTAVLEISDYVRKFHPDVGIIADGGIRYSGDICKALAAGAHAVMLGSLLAGSEESPGETILFQGRSYKSYRGMGSLGAMRKGSKDRYGQAKVSEASKLVPEGVEARVPYRGTLSQVIHQLTGGLRSGMGYVGAGTLQELVKKAKFRRILSGALKESHVHNVTITSEAPNYSGGSGEE